MSDDNNHDRTVVALIIHSLCFGGAERQVVEMARNLDPSEFDVFIVTFSDFTPLLDQDDPLRSKLRIINTHTRVGPLVLWHLFRLLRNLHVDIAHSFPFDTEIATRLVARLAGVRVVAGSERNDNYEISRWRWLIHQITLPLSDVIIANSNSGAAHHSNLYGLKRLKYAVVHNGVDTNRFKIRPRKECREPLHFDTSTIVIGTFASFKPQKNHSDLFHAMKIVAAKNDNVRLLLAGDSLFEKNNQTESYKSTLLSLLEECGLSDKTTILGNRTDVEKIYPACDLTVLPSLHEGTPNVILESMSCGIPAVLSDVSDNSKLVKDNVEGLIVRPGDISDLARKILFLCDETDTRLRMGKMARRAAVNRMSNEKMGQKLGNVYLDLLRSKSGSSN